MKKDNFELEKFLTERENELKKLKTELEYHKSKRGGGERGRGDFGGGDGYISKSLQNEIHQRSRIRKPSCQIRRPNNRPNNPNTSSPVIRENLIPIYNPLDNQTHCNNDGYEKIMSSLEEKNNLTSDANVFLHSYEVGSSLINEVFEQKNQLEKELVQSRKVIRGRRKPVSRKSNPMSA